MIELDIIYPSKYYPDMDKQIIKFLGRDDFTGGFYANTRELHYPCKTRSEAEQYKEELRNIKEIKCSIFEDDNVYIEDDAWMIND